MLSNTTLSHQLMRATLAKFEAERQSALAVLELYLTNAVGVSDHPSVVTEMAAAAERLTNAEEVISCLRRTFLVSDDVETDNDE